MYLQYRDRTFAICVLSFSNQFLSDLKTMVNGISHAFEDCFRRARIASIQAQSIHLPHFIEAIQCSFDNCILTKCNRMKRYIRHYKQCQLKRTGRCQACRILIIIKCSHVLNCKEKQCSFPDCSELKQKVRKYLD